ncbi:MAG: hypothetical protein KGO96_07255 [Elusimicrobia bacterium]|nr:hypothetical protein [Elusimicrobiota bacterium]
MSENNPEIQIKPRISNKKGDWKVFKQDDMISFVRADNMATIEKLSQEEDYIAIVPKTIDCKDGKLGPFKSLKSAKKSVQRYLHRMGFLLYRQDFINMRKNFLTNLKDLKVDDNGKVIKEQPNG